VVHKGLQLFEDLTHTELLNHRVRDSGQNAIRIECL
jgi:hypothetical protein